MINKKILLETQIEDFTSNGYPASYNIAEWIMQLYELEFKISTVRYYPHLFENTSTTELNRVLTELNRNVAIISKQLTCVIYDIYQTWYNYHNYYNSIQCMIFQYLSQFSVDETTNTQIVNLLKGISKLTQGKKVYTIKRDSIVLIEHMRKSIELRKFIARGLEYLYEDSNETSYYFLLEFRSIFPAPHENRLYWDITTQFDEYYRIIDDPNRAKSDKIEQRYLFKQFIVGLFTTFGAEWRTNLTEISRGGPSASSILVKMENTVKNQYQLLLNIDQMPQSTILFRMNEIIHQVHYTGNMTYYLEQPQRVGPATLNTLYYPLDISELYDPNIRANLFNHKYYFDATKQIKPTLRRIVNSFSDVEAQSEYINQSLYYLIHRKSVGQNALLTFLSKLPKPELRQWANELTQYGLDKHFHILMDI